MKTYAFSTTVTIDDDGVLKSRTTVDTPCEGLTATEAGHAVGKVARGLRFVIENWLTNLRGAGPGEADEFRRAYAEATGEDEEVMDGSRTMFRSRVIDPPSTGAGS